MVELMVSPERAVGELVLAAGLLGPDPKLLSWTATLADRWSLPIRLIHIGASGTAHHLDSGLERRLLALRADLPTLRIESRTVQTHEPPSAWVDQLRPHSLPVATTLPSLPAPWPAGPSAAVVIGPQVPPIPDLSGEVFAILDSADVDRVIFAARSVARTLDRPVQEVCSGDEVDLAKTGAFFTAVASTSPLLSTLLIQADHPLLVIGR